MSKINLAISLFFMHGLQVQHLFIASLKYLRAFECHRVGIKMNKLYRSPTVLELSIRKGQRNSRIVFIFVTCREKDYYHVVSVRQFSLDCCSYCEPRRRMQGSCHKHYFSEFPDFSFITLRIL